MYFYYRVKPFPQSYSSGGNNLGEVVDAVQPVIGEINEGRTGKLKPYTFYLVDADAIEPEELCDLIVGTSGNEGENSTFGCGRFLFLSNSRSFEDWKDKDNIPEDHERLKDNEFFVSVFRSYELGKFVSLASDENSRGGEENTNGELVPRIKNIVQKHEDLSYMPAVEQLLQEAKQDALALRNIAKEEGLKGPWEDLSNFLNTLNFIYQIKRRPHEDTDERIQKAHDGGNDEEAKWLGGYRDAFDLDRQLNEKDPGENLTEVASILRSYKVYRDLARWLASGAQHWVKEAGGVKALIIDQNLVGSDRDKAYLKRLDNIRKAFPKGERFSTDCVRDDEANGGSGSGVVDNLRSYLRNDKPLPVQELPDGSQEELEKRPIDDLLKYHVILVEAEFRGDFSGPEIVKELADHLDRQFTDYEKKKKNNQSSAQGEDDGNKQRPVIIVVSRTAHIGLIQQCLNLGAEWYLTTDRLYELPARMAQAHLPREFAEPRGRKSNFRLLYQLPRWDIVKLQEKVVAHVFSDSAVY